MNALSANEDSPVERVDGPPDRPADAERGLDAHEGGRIGGEPSSLADLDRLAGVLAGYVEERLVKRPRLVDRHKLAEQLSVSVATIERGIKANEIPVVRIGRRALFDTDEVIDAAKKRRASGKGKTN